MILASILGILFFVVIGIVLYMTYYNYVMAADNDSRLTVLAQKNLGVLQNLKSVTDDINYNDRILDATGKYVTNSIDNAHQEFSDQLSNAELLIRHDMGQLSSVYADGVGLRAKIDLSKASANIYGSMAESNMSFSNAITINKQLGDANLNARAIALSNMIYSTYTSNANAINTYKMNNDASLLSTQTMVSAQADSFYKAQKAYADFSTALGSFSNTAGTRIGNLESVNTTWNTTGLPNLMTQMRADMDTKDNNLYATVVKNVAEMAATAANTTGNVNLALVGYSNQMAIVGDNFTKAIVALNARSALDNPLRSNVYPDTNTGYIGLGGMGKVFSTTRLPATDLEISNTNPRMRLTGTQGAAYQLNGLGAALALDATGNMTLDANPMGTLTLQSKTARGVGVGAVPDPIYLTNYKLFVNGALGVANSNVLELGVGVVGKAPGAGTLQYNTSDNTLHIAGAGAAGARKLALDTENTVVSGTVTMNGSLNVGAGQKACVGATTCMNQTSVSGTNMYTDLVKSLTSTDLTIVSNGNTNWQCINGATPNKNLMQLTAGGALTVTGDVTAFGTITTLSDARLKNNFRKIHNPLDKVCSLNGYTYNTITNKDRDVGLLAQEVRDVLPEAIVEKNGYLTVAYGNLVALLVESIKELRQKVDAQNKC